MRRIFIFLLWLLSWASHAQEVTSSQQVDLKEHWLVYQSGQWAPFNNQSSTSIFFWVDGRKEKSNFLSIDGKHSFSVFVNSKLILQKDGKAKFSIDSLSKIYSPQFFVGVFAPRGVHQIHTSIEKTQFGSKLEAPFRKGNYFLDFTILATLILIVCFVLFLRTNPALTFDYLDVMKLFSFQNRDESTLTLRIASSVNLLIYLYGSFFLALMLLISLHFMGQQVSLINFFPIHSTGQGFWQWMILSVLIFGLLLIKLLWLVLLSALFDFRDTVSLQFFNFVRIILTSVCLLAAICTIYFVMGVRQENYFFHLLTILSLVFILGTALMYFKLLAKMPFHFFHLFSYLCASEIIPLMILVKVFFY
ncbi:MAG: DUF4271 domain-containing protein [Cyclobacteriaceae bacterium]